MSPRGVEDVRIDALPVTRDPRGALTVVEFSKSVPFAVARLFYVSGVPAGTSRGGHAHYRCSQYVICQVGRLGISLTDGVREHALELSSGQAILIEPGIFATQTYLDDESVLLVLCDRPYEAEDYIHGMDAFVKYCREKA
jgi:dTDP-4-dehydrorhamnose 3,5-epimerase-like enzyme